jgi:phosphate transport system substrate-binding protein
MRVISSVLVCGAALLLSGVPAFGQLTVDPKLPDYKPVAGVSGSIKSVGSDTMNNLMTLWSEGFLGFYPAVRVEIEGKGSSTAPPALIAGTATFGPMSRAMKPAEQDAFEKRFGYKPVQLGTSIDMLAIYINKDNPLNGLSFPQLDAVFSSTRKLGYKEDITKWGQVGLTGEWANAPVSLYGRNSASGTYAYVKKNCLGEGDYKPSVKEQPGSSSVVQGVASDKFGIGYSGIGYKTADVRVISLAKEEGGEMVPAAAERASEYPLARFLFLSVNYKPGSQLEPLRREFIRFVFSKQGQEAVVKDGYLPVTATIAKKQLSMVGIKAEF